MLRDSRFTLHEAMSKHSKWAKIKRQKGSADVKKGNIFTKLGSAIAAAARGGADPETNFKLRLAIEKARVYNMPNDTVARAIARGAGTLEGQTIEEELYEGFGPAGIAVIIETLTDNKNRTVQEIKRVLQDHNGRLGGKNSVTWMFHRKGIITIRKDALRPEDELALIDAGAEDIAAADNEITITVPPERLEVVRALCTQMGTSEATLAWLPKEYVIVPEEKKEAIKKIFEELDALDDVQEWYSNVDIEQLTTDN